MDAKECIRTALAAIPTRTAEQRDFVAALAVAHLARSGYVIFNPSEMSEEDKDRLYYILAKKSGETQNEMLRECFAKIAAAGERG